MVASKVDKDDYNFVLKSTEVLELSPNVLQNSFTPLMQTYAKSIYWTNMSEGTELKEVVKIGEWVRWSYCSILA